MDKLEEGPKWRSFSIAPLKLINKFIMLKQRKLQPWRVEYPVLICIYFDNFHFSLVFSRLRRYINHSRQSFIGYPIKSHFVNNTLWHVIFSTLFLVWISRWSNVSRVWYFTWNVRFGDAKLVPNSRINEQNCTISRGTDGNSELFFFTFPDKSLQFWQFLDQLGS